MLLALPAAAAQLSKPTPPVPSAGSTVDPPSQCDAVQGQLVTNCGFESGDLTGWTQTGDTTFSGVGTVDPIGVAPHSGSYLFWGGNVNDNQELSQAVTTTPGQHYAIQFYLAGGNDGSPGEVTYFNAVLQNGGTSTQFMSLGDVQLPGYTAYSFSFVAASSSATLAFNMENQPAYWDLDDVSVVAVAVPPTLSKTFGASAIPFGGQTSLSFTVSNPNTLLSLSAVGFSDSLPSGLVVATPSSGLTGSCGGGTISAVAGSNSISLSGASLAHTPAPGSSCTFSVNVIGISPGTTLINTTSAITSNEASPGTPATASLTVQSCPSGDNTYLLTATTSIGTIYGGVCISPVNVKATKQALYVGTYQQGPVSGQALLSVDPTTGTTTLTGQGFNLNMTATTAPGVNSFVESQPFSASGTFTLTTLP
jgi:hypothetical protein